MFTLTHNSIAVTEEVTFRIVWLLTVSTPSPGFRTKLESVPSGMFPQSYANISDPITSPDEMSASCRECSPRCNILCCALLQ